MSSYQPSPDDRAPKGMSLPVRVIVFAAPVVVPVWGIWQQRHKASGDDWLGIGIVLGIFCVVVPLGLITFRAVSSARSRALFETGASTIGEIWQKTSSTGEHSAWLVWLKFTDQNDVRVEQKFDVGPYAYEQLEVGDTLPVVFDPQRPRRAVLGPREALPDVLRHLHEPDGAGCFAAIVWFFSVLGLFMVWIGLAASS